MTRDTLTAREGAPFDPEIARDVQDWLDTAPPEFLLCRRNHRWPKLVARNGKLPSGVKAESLIGRAGSFQIRQKCPDCGTFRVFTYLSGTDLFEASRKYHYEWPDGYKMPRGAYDYISDADCQRAGMEASGLGVVLDKLAAEQEAAA
jgi:hypothetical protein